ncbi:MAG: 2-hydroxyacyl-CoA dehydratase family protein, partial [Chloroflexi bacterium]|nr:2-hydroxyacyl-CoA dehydratase family protein [Chloroflexota bacterium]
MNRGLTRAEQIYQDRGLRARELKAEGKKVIGYFCTFTPVEMLTAAGVLPFRITGSMKDQMTLVDGYLETIACPFTRSALDLALNGKYSFLDGFVIPHACDNIVKLYDIWPHYIKHEYAHFVNVPHTTSLPSLEFFEAELATFRRSLERYVGHGISSDELNQSIRPHNEQRRLVRQLYELRKKDPPPISGAEMTKVLVAIVSLPVTEANDLLRAVISDVMGRGPEQQMKKATRLMICGVGNEG